MDKITNSKIKMYISAGAMVINSVRDKPIIHICGTDDKINETFLKFKDTTLMRQNK